MDHADPPDTYLAGSCNIGDGDVRARRRLGWLGAALTLALAAVLLAFGLPPIAMLATTPAAYLAATGFVQARSRFCVGYAAAGRYGFGAERGPTGRVEGDADRAADRTRARELNGVAARWTIAATSVLVAVAWLVG